ncbi:hypothetical protein I6N90_15790 [Paenibacillus sp. GSMTC-2017]|uniref:YugN family protein n=1 Tax=Paenibacillus sp. GSMTC-2017 TaxID=2794350 RepID=UPI0018D5E7B9|nr:YugN family protein [Paenibacillus sp. GSMTC-2017]MBH5319266.1 hypothetical protein [Paenibacillus sp. GSMTC-2017]
MIPVSSIIDGKQKTFTEAKQWLENNGFTLGGNWDYNRGSFDRALDKENKVWLRIPFEVTEGTIDSELTENNAHIRFEEPYVLKHLYNEGNDPEASVRVVAAAFDQFQSPVNPDADIEQHWVNRGKEMIRQLETSIPN